MPTPVRTSLAEIVAAAQTALESDGPRGVTMQTVADRVGVKAPSLYKHVRDRDALIRLVAQQTVRDLAARLESMPPVISDLMHAYRRFAHERPQGTRLMLAVDGITDDLARAGEPVIDAARTIVPESEALSAARLVTAWANGFIEMELAGSFRLGGDVEAAFEYALDRLERGLRG